MKMVNGMDVSGMTAFLDFLYTEPTIYVVLAWTLIWEGLGLWNAGRNGQKRWFIAIFLLNTIGILPLIYLLFFSNTPLCKNCRKFFGMKSRPKKARINKR
jgi:hypothetical protein